MYICTYVGTVPCILRRQLTRQTDGQTDGQKDQTNGSDNRHGQCPVRKVTTICSLDTMFERALFSIHSFLHTQKTTLLYIEYKKGKPKIKRKKKGAKLAISAFGLWTFFILITHITLDILLRSLVCWVEGGGGGRDVRFWQLHAGELPLPPAVGGPGGPPYLRRKQEAADETKRSETVLAEQRGAH